MKVAIKIGCLLLVFVSFGCAPGRTAFDKAQQLERSGMYDEAVMKYAEAVSKNPDTSEYRLRFLKASEIAAKNHLQAGDALLNDSRFDEAYEEYQKAMAMDASQERAKQQSELVLKFRNSKSAYEEGVAFQKENKFKEAVRSYQRALNLNPANKDAGDALEKLMKTRRLKSESFELNLRSTKPITLKFKDAKLKDVFNIITQLSGINFVFDDAIKEANVTIYLENATFQQALDIITGMQKLNKKVLNESTIIIYPKTPDKIKQYEDLYVQTFFLNKLDAKKAVNLIRTMLQVKKIYVNEEMNTLVIRDTLDVIEVAQRILEANDVPDAEVILEVEVIELSKKNSETFGMALSKYAIGYNTLSPSGAFFTDTMMSTTTTGTTTTTSTADTSQLLNLFRWGSYNGFITVPNATFNFGKKLGNAETLSNPKIRVKNREKAKFNVGTRVPITTTSSNGVGNYNVNVQYVDVGVKINAEPTIQLNNDVNIKLGLEVSSILSKETVGSDKNTTVATIGTRNLDTVLSLKDGETSIIGGLIQDTKGQNADKIFFLGDIPVIGQLFSNRDNSNDKTELVLAITPRIIRSVAVADPDISAFWSGLEDDPAVSKHYGSFTQEPEFAAQEGKQTKPAQSEAGAKQAPAVPVPAPALPVQKESAQQAAEKQAIKQIPSGPEPIASPQPPVVPGAPTTAGVPSLPPVVQPVPLVPQPAGAAGTPVAAAPPVPSPPRLPPVLNKVSLRIAAPASVKQNEQFTVDVMVGDASNLSSTPLTLVFDAAALEVISLAEGNFLNQDARKTVFTNKVDNQAGQLSVKISREGEGPGISGAGKLFSVTFKAKAKGPASIGFIGVKLATAEGKQLDSILYNAVVEVKQI